MRSNRRTTIGAGVLAAAALTGAVYASAASAAPSPSTVASASTARAATDPTPGPGRMAQRWASLTDAQRTCLTNAGVTVPTTKPATKPTAEERKARRAALAAAAPGCGITLPERQGPADGS